MEKDWPELQEILGQLEESVPAVPWMHLFWKDVSNLLPGGPFIVLT